MKPIAAALLLSTALLAHLPGVDRPVVAGAAASSDVPAGDALLVFGKDHWDLQLATSLAQQQRGLAGRSSLPKGQGMLFVYTGLGERCFTMKGMRFRLDIAWLSVSDTVLSIEEDLSPKYTSVYCAVSSDVVELRGGQAKGADIKYGSHLEIIEPR